MSDGRDEAESRALARKGFDIVARTPKDIQPGQVVFVDRRGVALERAGVAWRVKLVRYGFFGACVGGAALSIGGHRLLGVLLYLAGATPMLVARYRGGGRLFAIDRFARLGDLDDAQRRLDALSVLRRRDPGTYGHVAGNLASHRGDHAAAITWWREALPHTKRLGRVSLRQAIARALLLSGKCAEARFERDAAVYPPTADALINGQLDTQVMFALLDPETAPLTDDDLHDMTRTALAYSHTGITLAALGWTYERRGDAETARWLATEATERMHYRHLATWWPALQQWLDRQLAPT